MTRAWAVTAYYAPAEDPIHPIRRTFYVFADCGHEAAEWARGAVRHRGMSIHPQPRLMATGDWLALLAGMAA